MSRQHARVVSRGFVRVAKASCGIACVVGILVLIGRYSPAKKSPRSDLDQTLRKLQELNLRLEADRRNVDAFLNAREVQQPVRWEWPTSTALPELAPTSTPPSLPDLAAP